MLRAPFSVFRYSSYSEFLQDAYEHLHKQDPRFSYELIAALSELKSRTQVRNFIKGILKPTQTQLRRLAGVFGLEADEMDYLLCLHQFEEVQGSAAAVEIFQRLVRMQKKNLPDADPFREFQVASSVLHMTLLTYLSIPGAFSTPDAIADALKSRYTPEQIKAGLGDLEEYGYIARESGDAPAYRLLQKHIKTYDLNPNYFLRTYHQECLDIAEQALHQETTDDRYLVGASLSINSKIYPRVIQKLNQFMENLMQLEGVGGPPDTVIQLSTQVVKMSRPQPAETLAQPQSQPQPQPQQKEENTLC